MRGFPTDGEPEKKEGAERERGSLVGKECPGAVVQ